MLKNQTYMKCFKITFICLLTFFSLSLADPLKEISIEFGGHDILEMPEAFMQQSYVDQEYYEDVIEHVIAGNQLSKMGEYLKAVERFRKALNTDSTYVFSHNGLANAYLKLGNSPLAEKHFLKAILYAPNYAFSYNNLANLYLSQGDIKKAENLLRTALKYEPNSAYIHYNMGNIFFIKEKYSQAIAYYRKALRFDDNLCDARYNLAIAYKNKNMSTLMLKEYEVLIKKCPGHKKGVLNLSANYIIGGKIDEALLIYKQALILNPDPEIFLALGHAYHNLGYSSREIKAYESAIQADSTFLPAWKFLASSYHELGMTVTAVETCTKGLEIDPLNTELSLLLNKITQK